MLVVGGSNILEVFVLGVPTAVSCKLGPPIVLAGGPPEFSPPAVVVKGLSMGTSILAVGGPPEFSPPAVIVGDPPVEFAGCSVTLGPPVVAAGGSTVVSPPTVGSDDESLLTEVVETGPICVPTVGTGGGLVGRGTCNVGS